MELTGDGRLADASTEELPDLLGIQCCGGRPAETLAVFPRMSQSSLNALTKDLPFKLSKDRKQSRHSPTRWCGQIQSFRERYETDVEIAEFLEGGDQIGHRTSPAVQAPDDDHIDVAAARGIQQFLPQFPHGGSRSDFFDLDRDGPATTGNVIPHGAMLQLQCLLIVGGDTSVEASATPRFLGMAKNPA